MHYWYLRLDETAHNTKLQDQEGNVMAIQKHDNLGNENDL